MKKYLINLFKTKKLKMLGLAITWLVPLFFLIIDGAKVVKTSTLKFELYSIPCFGILLIIYYKKIKQKLHDIFLIKGFKGVPLGPIYYLITTLVNVALLFVCYAVVKVLQAMNNDIETFLMLCICCLVLGGCCNIADSINQLKAPEEAKEEKINNEKKN